MKLLKKLGRRKSETAKFYQSWGLFLCPFCNKRIEKTLANGKYNNSCGCMRTEHAIKHGLFMIDGKRNPIFTIWYLMRERCKNPKATHYKYYGGRGISVCSEWANDFAIFHKWAIEHGWEKGLQIDRINNDGNYEPLNCRFVTCQINIQNSRIAKLTPEQIVEIRQKYGKSGETYKEFAKHYEVNGGTISNIIRNKTWGNHFSPVKKC
uniref:Uncharacterized protein n=1 Tax=viral metagenome TaxID=1070528 RepID=A0A6M3IM27_9ZZZZ